MHRANDAACARRRRTARGRRRGRTRRARSDGRGGRRRRDRRARGQEPRALRRRPARADPRCPPAPHAKTWRCARWGVTRASSSSAAAGESAGSGCQCVRSPGRSSASRSALADAAVSVSVAGWNSSAVSRPCSAMRSTSAAVRSVTRRRSAVDDAGVTPNSVQMRTIGEPSADAVSSTASTAASSLPSGGAMPRYEPYDTTSSPASRLRAPSAAIVGPPPGGAWPSAPHSMPSTPARQATRITSSARQRTERDRAQSRRDHRRVRFRVAFLIVASSTRSGRSL